jgi:integrase/recombinase XerD
MKRHFSHTSRRLYVREQLVAYGPQISDEAPFREQYLQFMLTERGCKESTATNNLKLIRQFARFLKQEYNTDPFEPTEVTPRHIRRYLTYLKSERGNSASTRNTKLAALGSYYLFLECYEYIEEEDNPTLFIKRSRVPRRLPVFLTVDEAKELLIASSGVAEPERNLAIMRIMIQAGLRVQEIINLCMDDVDLKEGTLLIDGKGNRQRLVPLTSNTRTALRKYLQVRCSGSPLTKSLFLNLYGEPLDGKELYYLFKDLCEIAGINKPGLSIRHLRHTCLTLLLKEGADLMALKKLAGHATLKTTQLYLHVTQGQLRDAMKKHPLQ